MQTRKMELYLRKGKAASNILDSSAQALSRSGFVDGESVSNATPQCVPIRYATA